MTMTKKEKKFTKYNLPFTSRTHKTQNSFYIKLLDFVFANCCYSYHYYHYCSFFVSERAYESIELKLLKIRKAVADGRPE